MEMQGNWLFLGLQAYFISGRGEVRSYLLINLMNVLVLVLLALRL